MLAYEILQIKGIPTLQFIHSDESYAINIKYGVAFNGHTFLLRVDFNFVRAVSLEILEVVIAQNVPSVRCVSYYVKPYFRDWFSLAERT